MKYLYKRAVYPENTDVLSGVNKAAERLEGKLRKVDLTSLPVSDYTKKYLGYQIKDLSAVLQRYAYIVIWSLGKRPASLKELVFTDYGGGPSVMWMLAKELGMGTVIYNDIYEVSCHDAGVVGEAIGIGADHYVRGDVDDLKTYLDAHAVTCRVVASYDVIEHVYDVEAFLKKLCRLSEGPLRLVMASGANASNPWIRKKIVKQHREMEHQDREAQWGHKERDCLKAYHVARKDIISAHAGNLSPEEADHLARATRGLMAPDIRKRVDRYLRTGERPPMPAHPTNTCDPYTGNWAEHLMEMAPLIRCLSEEGFQTKLLSGYYPDASNDFRKKGLAHVVNPLITLLGSKGRMLAPFHTLVGERDLHETHAA